MKEDYKVKLDSQRNKVRDVLVEYLKESRDSKEEWNSKYKQAWDMIQGRVDWSYKRADQSRIHMNKIGLALEQFKAQVKQGLMKFDRWLTVEYAPGAESQLLSDMEAWRLLERGFASADYKVNISDAIGIGAIENRATLKLSTEVQKVKGKNVVKLNFQPLYCEDFHVDPRNENLYQIHEIFTDKRNILAMSDSKPNKLKPYRKDAVEKLTYQEREDQTAVDEKGGTTQHVKRTERRNPIVIHEAWCTILNDDGSVLEWEKEDGSKFPLENVVITMANEDVIIRDPEQNPRWAFCAPFVTTQILRYPGSTWGKSLLLPGVDLNQAEDELISAMTDGALKAVYNVNQIRVSALARPEQVAGGLSYGTDLLVNDSLPPGAKAVETVSTGTVPPDAMQILHQIQRSAAENMMTNEINLSGALPSKQVRATELIQAGNVITGLYESIVGDIEDTFVEPLAEQVFKEMLQYSDYLSDSDLLYIFNGDPQRIEQFKQTSAKQKYEELAVSFRFRAKGMRSLASNARAAQAINNLFAAVASNPLLVDIIRTEYSIPKMFKYIVRGNNLDDEELKLSEREKEFERQKQLIMEQQMRQAEMEGQNLGQQGEAGRNAPQSLEGMSEQGTMPGSGSGQIY